MDTARGETQLLLKLGDDEGKEWCLLWPFRPGNDRWGCIPGPSARAVTGRAFSPGFLKQTDDLHRRLQTTLTPTTPYVVAYKTALTPTSPYVAAYKAALAPTPPYFAAYKTALAPTSPYVAAYNFRPARLWIRQSRAFD